MAAGIPGWAQLEEARSRLLHSTVPPGLHRGRELQMRMAMWEVGQYSELLGRIEWQLMGMRTACRRRGHNVRRRALHQVRHGAYKKAVASVTTSVATFSPEEGAQHAAALLPGSGAADALATAPS
eukprot:11646180-Karenia_brevis.AAC.1